MNSSATGIRVQAVEARSSVRERLRGEGVDDKLGVVNRFTSVADAVEAWGAKHDKWGNRLKNERVRAMSKCRRRSRR